MPKHPTSKTTRPKRTLALSFALLAASAVGSAAAVEPPNVSTVPISDRLIQGKIRLASDGEIVNFTALEGGLVTVQVAGGASFGVAGEILDAEKDHVRFTVFEIERYGPGLDGLKQIDQIEVQGAQAKKVPKAGIAALSVSGIEAGPLIAEAQPE